MLHKSLRSVLVFSLCIFICILLSAVKVTGQTFNSTAIDIESTKIIVNKISNPNTEITDITEIVKKRCHLESNVKINSRQSLEIKYESIDELKIKKLQNSLVYLIEKLSEKLRPLSMPSIVLYLLKSDQIPQNYRFVESSGMSRYPIVFLYKNEDELDLECNSFSTFCEEIYATTTHEITHLAISSLIDTNDSSVRWFDEGLANFIEEDLSSNFAPDIYKRKLLTTFPSVSLNRSYIRQNIWSWRTTNSLESLGKLNTWESKWNELSLYGASGEIFRILFNYSDKSSKYISLNQFLEYIKEAAKNKPLRGKDVLSAIKNQFGVDLKSIGVLTNSEKEKFIERSFAYLSASDKNDPLSKAQKYWALSILASLSNQIPDTMIFSLIRIVKDPAESEINRNLAATALQQRIRYPQIKRIIQNETNLSKIIKSLTFESALE